MDDFERVLRRVRAGDRVRFYEDYFGGTTVVVRRRWLPQPGRRVKLSDAQCTAVRETLAQRGRRVRRSIEAPQ
jgi:hypothetical protein